MKSMEKPLHSMAKGAVSAALAAKRAERTRDRDANLSIALLAMCARTLV